MEHLNESGNFDMFKPENKPQPMTPLMYRTTAPETPDSDKMFLLNLRAGINNLKKMYLCSAFHYICMIGLVMTFFILLFSGLTNNNFSFIAESALFSGATIIIFLANYALGLAMLVTAFIGIDSCEEASSTFASIKFIYFAQLITSALSFIVFEGLKMTGLSLFLLILSTILIIAYTIKLIQKLLLCFEVLDEDSEIPSDAPRMISNTLRKFVIFAVGSILLCVAGIISIYVKLRNVSNASPGDFRDGISSIYLWIKNDVDMVITSLNIGLVEIAIGFLLFAVACFIVSSMFRKLENILPKSA